MTAGRQADVLAAGGAMGLAVLFGLAVSAVPFLLLAVALVALAAAVAALAHQKRYTAFAFGFSAVCASLVLLPANGMRITASATFADALLVVASGFVLFGMLAHWRAPLPPRWLIGGAALLVLSVPVSLLFEPVSRPEIYIFSERAIGAGQGTADVEPWIMGARVVFAWLVVPYVIAVTLTTWGRVRVAVDAWMLGAGLSAAGAVIAAVAGLDYQEAVTGATYSFRNFGAESDRLTGLTVHPATLGLVSAMAAPVAMAKLAGSRAWGWAGLLAVLVAAVVLSGSRAPLLALAVGGAYVAWRVPVARNRLLAVALAAMAVGYVQSVDVSQFGIVQRLTGQAISSAQSDSQRGVAFEQSVGYGIERAATGWGFDIIRGAHNAELAMLLGGGVLALGALLALGWGTLGIGRSLARRRDIPEDMRTLAVALLGSLGVWAVAAQFQANVIDRWLFIPAGILLGMWFAASEPTPSGPSDRAPARGGATSDADVRLGEATSWSQRRSWTTAPHSPRRSRAARPQSHT